MFWVYAAIVVSIAAFALAAYLYQWVRKQPGGSERAEEIALLIRRGANTFLSREYRILAVFAGVIACIIFVFLPEPIWKSGNVLLNLQMALAFLFGAFLSGLAGKIGIDVATIANLKSAVAAQKSIVPAFDIAFKGGAVMGMAVVGASLFGAGILYIVTRDPNTVLSFSFGASTLALFAKAGGGIYTKTADISADLVGKVELGIPEDDPRNPAVIADNVGDNVGDIAGMGADLFDSNIASIAAAMVIGLAIGEQDLVFCYNPGTYCLNTWRIVHQPGKASKSRQSFEYRNLHYHRNFCSFDSYCIICIQLQHPYLGCYNGRSCSWSHNRYYIRLLHR